MLLSDKDKGSIRSVFVFCVIILQYCRILNMQLSYFVVNEKHIIDLI